MTEQAAKLTVKVKLHAMQPVVLPTKALPARFSKLKVTLGLLVLLLLSAAGYFFWGQFVGKVPHAVAADDVSLSGHSTAQTQLQQAATAQAPLIEAPLTQASMPQTATSVAEAAVVTSAKLQATTESGDATVVAGNDELQTPVQQNSRQPGSTVQTSQQIVPPTTPAKLTGRTLPEGFSRIVLAATMEQLEPGAAIDSLVAKQQIQRLYLFTELKGYAGQQLIHRWSFAGQVQTEALLTIEDSPWRTYSEKWLLPDQLGSWRVEIIDQQQHVLYQHDFQYQ